MDPTDPGDRPPEPEQPLPPRPAWPSPPPAAIGPGQPPGPAPPAPPGRGPPPGSPPPRSPPGAAGPARPAAPARPDPRTDLPKLLAKRAKAIVDDDRTAFMSTVDKRQKAWYREQSTSFGRMRTVPFSAFSYRIVELRAGSALKRRYHADQVYLSQVEARYRFTGQDASPVLTSHSFAFV